MRPEERVSLLKSRGIWVGRFHDFKSKNGNVKKATLCRHVDLQYKTLKNGKKRKRTQTEMERELERLWQDKYNEIKQGASRGPHKNTRLKFSDVVQEWLEEVEKTRDEKTSQHYADSCTQLIESIGDISMTNPPRSFDAKFCEALEKKGVSDATINSRIRDIQTCLNWAYNQEILPRKYKLTKLRVTKKQPGILSDQNLQDIEDYITRKMSPNMIRAYMMMRYTAMRAGEVRALPLSRIQTEIHIADCEEAGFKVKGRQEDFLPILPELMAFLDRDLAQRLAPEYWYLDDGKGNINWASVGEMSRPFKKMFESLNITGVKPLHGFRATAISNLLDNGVSPRIVQALARHEKIETTMGYHNDTNLQIAPQITGLI